MVMIDHCSSDHSVVGQSIGSGSDQLDGSRAPTTTRTSATDRSATCDISCNPFNAPSVKHVAEMVLSTNLYDRDRAHAAAADAFNAPPLYERKTFTLAPMAAPLGDASNAPTFALAPLAAPITYGPLTVTSTPTRESTDSPPSDERRALEREALARAPANLALMPLSDATIDPYNLPLGLRMGYGSMDGLITIAAAEEDVSPDGTIDSPYHPRTIEITLGSYDNLLTDMAYARQRYSILTTKFEELKTHFEAKRDQHNKLKRRHSELEGTSAAKERDYTELNSAHTATCELYRRALDVNAALTTLVTGSLLAACPSENTTDQEGAIVELVTRLLPTPSGELLQSARKEAIQGALGGLPAERCLERWLARERERRTKTMKRNDRRKRQKQGDTSGSGDVAIGELEYDSTGETGPTLYYCLLPVWRAENGDLSPAYIWCISHRLWNKAIHALIGNGTSAGSIIRKLHTQGMPLLREEDTSPEAFLSFRIDLHGWAAAQGITEFVIGPLPTCPTVDPQNPASVDLYDAWRDSVTQGMRYVCHAVRDANLRASMATEINQKSGPTCIQWLTTEILQSQAEQPALQRIVDAMTLRANESPVAFKARFCKFYYALTPRPAPETGCAKFVTALTKDSSGRYDDCVTAALSSTPQSNLQNFINKLVLLCTNKNERVERQADNTQTALLGELQALRAQMQELQKDASRPTSRTGRGGAATSRGAECFNCGARGHLGKDCPKPRAKCDFVFPDGTPCRGGHLTRFCFFKNPTLARDSKVRDMVRRKLAQHSGNGEDKGALCTECTDGDSSDDAEEEEVFFHIAIEYLDDTASTTSFGPVSLPDDVVLDILCPMLDNTSLVNLASAGKACALECAPCIAMRVADAYDAAARRGYASPMAEVAFERARAAQQREMQTSLRADRPDETESCLLCQDTLPLCPCPIEGCHGTVRVCLECGSFYCSGADTGTNCDVGDDATYDAVAHAVSDAQPTLEALGIGGVVGHGETVALAADVVDAHGGARHESGSYLYVDTGASDHIFSDPSCIVEPEKHRPVKIRIRTGNGVSYAQSRGPVEFQVVDQDGNRVTITRDAIFCPDFGVNLYSPSRDWKDYRTSVQFGDTCTIAFSEGVVPFVEERGSYKLYYSAPARLAFGAIPAGGANSHGAIELPRPTDAVSLWHRRLGHAPFSGLRHLPAHAVGPDFVLTKSLAQTHQTDCLICNHARMKAAPHGENRVERTAGARKPLPNPHKKFGDCIFMDLAGPLPLSAFHFSARYISIFVDGATRHIAIYLIRTKDQQIEVHKRYCADHARFGALEAKHFHSDNGGEYTSKEYCDLITDNGALKTTIVAKSPAMNTNAEASFFRVFSTIRALLIDSGLPTEHWGAAAQLAAYLSNRTTRTSGKATAYELLNGRPPNLQHLRVFGCLASALKPRVDRTSKIHDVAETGFYVGPSRYQRGSLLWIPGRRQYIVARTVQFNERVLYAHHFKIPPTPGNAAGGGDGDDEDGGSDDGDDSGGRPKQAPRPMPPATNAAPPPPGAGRVMRPRSNVVYFPPAQRYANGQQAQLSTVCRAAPLADEASTTGESNADPATDDEETKTFHSEAMALDALIHDENNGSITAIEEPQNFYQAMRSPQAEHWKAAMREELDSHRANGTWTSIDASQVPKGTKVVGSTWTFKLKRNADGTIARYKARLCAQGFSQVEGLHYSQTYSNTVTRESFRVLLAMAARLDLKLSGADVKTAYLYADIDKGLFLAMRLPPGFEETGSDGYPRVGHLRRAIYGLKQSAARWEARLSEYLLGYGFTKCEADPCLYKFEKDGATLFLAVYVDDLIFATSHDSLREHVLGDLRREFKITDTGPLTWVLGSNVSQNLREGTVTLSQKLYVEDITKIVLSGEQPQPDKGSRVNPASETLIKLEPGDTGNPNLLYRKGVGMLAWLVAISRPDLAYTQSMLARYSGCGGESHLKCLIHAVQYLQRTKSYSLTYRKQGSDKLLDNIQAHSKFRPEALDAEDLISFTDASSGGEKPMAGEVHFLAGGPVAWRSGRLSDTPLNSAEAEYVAASRAATTTIVLRSTISFFITRERAPRPTVMFCDNLAAVMLSDSNITSKRMKHVMTRLAYLRERVGANDLYLYHIGTKGQIADIMTKSLATQTFHELRALLLT